MCHTLYWHLTSSKSLPQQLQIGRAASYTLLHIAFWQRLHSLFPTIGLRSWGRNFVEESVQPVMVMDW